MLATFGNFEVPLPGLTGTIDDVACNGILFYISVIFNYVIAIVVIIAVIGVVIGGFSYMTSGGSDDGVKKGKDLIKSSLLSIVLALGAFLILNTISTQFASDLQEPTINPDKPINRDCK